MRVNHRHRPGVAAQSVAGKRPDAAALSLRGAQRRGNLRHGVQPLGDGFATRAMTATSRSAAMLSDSIARKKLIKNNTDYTD
jgi:hypothetical protein